MRLFAAALLPAATAAVAAAGVERSEWPGAAWVRPENLHLTLAFFGDTAPDALEPLTDELRRELASFAPIAARLDGAGAFPDRGPIRVVWLGVEPATELESLAGAVRRAARAAGVAFDEKPVRSHLTLCRCRRPWPPSKRRELGRLAVAAADGFEVRAVALVESELAAGGSRYATRAAVALGRAA